MEHQAEGGAYGIRPSTGQVSVGLVLDQPRHRHGATTIWHVCLYPAILTMFLYPVLGYDYIPVAGHE